MAINSRPDKATIARHGLSGDAGVLVVTGTVVVGGSVFGRVVQIGHVVELVAVNRGAGVNVSRDVSSGNPRSSNP
jgi:hypothetical protein